MPDKIISKPPNDGLLGKTDEEKMGVTYKQIEEMIEKGDTEEAAKVKIIKMYKKTMHKRRKVPVYKIDRKNYLTEMGED